ncbi:MAG TPA: potassium transporter Trk [Microbacteriaceae bacterium]|nr:potassium transporter Trk [Microbacteriaceae bacterium]
MTDSAETATVHSQQVRLRRAPKFGSFMLLGAGFGVFVGVALAVGQPVSGNESLQQVIGFLSLLCGVIGMTAGALVALIFDRILARRSRTVEATHTEVESA